MNKEQIITETADFIKDKFTGEESGHDWWHMYRVWQLAKTLTATEEGADLFIVELAALLHDIADWKFHDGDEDAGPLAAAEWLESLGLEGEIVERVTYIVRHISFKGGTNTHVMQTIEGKIVQDADRLDAIGAIGIARTFAFGGARGRSMYEPNIKPKEYKTLEEFRANMEGGTTINHFYEKLLTLKNGMNTESGKRMAQSRHAYMEDFLTQFYAEWEGER